MSHSTSKSTSIIIPFLTTLICLLVVEFALRFAEKHSKINRYDLFRSQTAESFYFSQETKAPPVTPPHHFDRLFGWRNFGGNPGGGKKESVNRQGWRSRYEFKTKKSRTRIAFIGDSYGFGWAVDDAETIPEQLQKRLGSRYEVMNFSARGYGLDQISLVATELVNQYIPDAVILAYIAADLYRSCSDFQFNSKKPRFIIEDGRLKLTGVPVPTPFETFSAHQSPSVKLKDRGWTLLRKSRIVSLIAQVLSRKAHKQCIDEINPMLLHRVKLKYPNIPLLAVHLDGVLPESFDERVKTLGIHSISIPPQQRNLANQLHLEPKRHPDGHPMAPLNQIYAEALYRQILAYKNKL